MLHLHCWPYRFGYNGDTVLDLFRDSFRGFDCIDGHHRKYNAQKIILTWAFEAYQSHSCPEIFSHKNQGNIVLTIRLW